MFTKQQERELCGFALYIENHEEEFKYQLLDRLRCDCEFFHWKDTKDVTPCFYWVLGVAGCRCQ